LSAVPQHALAADRPGVFTARQRNGIKKIARNSGLPHDQQWDFVHETWVKVAEVWPQVPRVEPRMSRYIFRMAKNLAIDLFRRFKEDAMTGAVVFSCLEAWEQKREEKQEAGERFEDDLGMPQVARPRVDARTRAEQFMKHAVGRDPEAAGWMWRMRVEGETGPEIAAAVGQSSKNVYQRVSRLEEALARLEPPEPQTIGRLVEAYAEERGVDLRRRGRFRG
jgi:DNA-directed RNA polymerase specialized sigma24 family protein